MNRNPLIASSSREHGDNVMYNPKTIYYNEQ